MPENKKPKTLQVRTVLLLWIAGLSLGVVGGATLGWELTEAATANIETFANG